MKGVAIAAYSLAVICMYSSASRHCICVLTLLGVIAHNKYSLWVTNFIGFLKIITLVL